jgi:predicted adenylyl cyclase CyaB
MAILNVEIKARCKTPEKIEEFLQQRKARFIGMDHQIDTYFKSGNGRLKLREGNIENSLIYYDRDNTSGPKTSKVLLYKTKPDSSLKEILTKSNGVLCVVDKKRKIFFIENVKFHIDTVKGLGRFVEIEAIDETGDIGKEKLQKQAEYYLNMFHIQQEDLVAVSYSDLLINKEID